MPRIHFKVQVSYIYILIMCYLYKLNRTNKSEYTSLKYQQYAH